MTILAHRDYRAGDRYHADVIVVGTGAGGGVVGTELAELGHDVLFVEEGGYHPTSSFNPYLTESLPRSSWVVHPSPTPKGAASEGAPSSTAA